MLLWFDNLEFVCINFVKLFKGTFAKWMVNQDSVRRLRVSVFDRACIVFFLLRSCLVFALIAILLGEDVRPAVAKQRVLLTKE